MSEYKVFTSAFQAIPSGFAKIISTPFWCTIGTGFVAALTFMFGHEYTAYAFAGLLVVDGITGWAKARKNGSKPDSTTLGEKTLAKLMVYLIPLLGWSLMEVMLENCGAFPHGTLYPIRTVIIGWIASRELLSILENMDSMYGDEYHLIRVLYNKVKGIEEHFTGQIDSTIKTESDIKKK